MPNHPEAAEPKPLPEITPESAPYWAGLRQHKLLLQRCGECAQLRHYPRTLCDRCYSTAVTWVEASGSGTVHSWTIVHHAFHPGFTAEVPYALVTVDLWEGVRLQAPLRGDYASLRLGQAVRLIFEARADGFVTPAFSYAES